MIKVYVAFEWLALVLFLFNHPLKAFISTFEAHKSENLLVKLAKGRESIRDKVIGISVAQEFGSFWIYFIFSFGIISRSFSGTLHAKVDDNSLLHGKGVSRLS